MKKTSKKLFISALLVMMLLLCINATSADDTLNQNLTISDNTANDIAEVANDEAVNAEDTADKLSASGDTYVVDANGGGDYTSISAAVSAATGGETILIKNGEYTESTALSFTKSVKLIGESNDGVSLKSSGNIALLQTSTSASGITVSFENINFIDSARTGGNGLIFIAGTNNNVNFTKCNFKDLSSKYGAIQTNTAGTLNIRECTFENVKEKSNSAGTGLMYLNGGGTVNIYDSVINNCGYEATSGQMNALIYLYGATGTVNIEGTTISNTKGPSGSLIRTAGIVNIKNSRIVNNTIEVSSAGYVGDSLFYVTKELNIEQSVIADNQGPKNLLYSSAAGTTTFEYNNIQNNTFNGGFKTTDGVLNAEANYWGSNTLPADVTATTWVVENNGEYKLNNGQPLEKTVPELNSDDEPSTEGTIFVSATGDDSKDGLSEANAVATIAHAIEIAELGKIVLLDGIHVIDATLKVNKDLDIKGKGTAVVNGNSLGILENNANLNLTNIIFTNAKLATGAIIKDNGNTTINGCTFFNANTTSNSATGPINNLKGTMTINNSKFYNLKGARGVIASQGGTKFIMNNSEVYDNDCTSFANAYGILRLEGCEAVVENTIFRNNKAKQGAGLWLNRAGSHTMGSLTANNLTFINNVAQTGNGAAIYISSPSNSANAFVLNVNNSKFINNLANKSANNVGGTGSAIYMTSGPVKVTVTQSVFINNSANNPNNNDSAVYVGTGTLDIYDSIILNNDDEIRYAINNAGGSVTAENNWWGNNDKANTNVQVDKIVKMTAELTPGSAQAGDAVTIAVSFDNENLPKNVINVTLTSTSGSLNKVITMNGATDSVNYNGDKNDDSISVKSSQAEVILEFGSKSDVIFVSPGASNSNPGTRDAPVGTIAHALEMTDGEIVLLEGVHKVDGLDVYDSVNITGEGNAVIDAQNNNRIFHFGTTAKAVITNVTMINGFSSDESGALLSSSYDLTLINCTLANSTAGTNNGGAIYSVGKLTIINTTIANCSAHLGGAIYTNNDLAVGNTINLINSTLENNIATGNDNSGGGAIFAQKITGFTIDNTSFINNEAQTSSSGGAIFISHSDADVKITNSEFINNTAKNSGGAIYRAGTSNYVREGTMTITGTLFENNTCNGDGGAVYVRATTLNIANSVLINNKDAGGLAVYGYKTEQVAPAVTLNDNWWGSNDSPKDLVGGNGYKPTLTRWAILTVENASEIKAGETVKLTVSINKYTDGTSNGTLTNPITVPRTAEFTTTSDEFSEVLENGELVYDYVIPTGLKYLAVTVDDETVVLYVVTTNTTVIIDPVDGKKYDKVSVTVTVKAIDDSIVDMGEIELYVENKLIATLSVSEGNAIGEIVISQNDGKYNLTAKYVEKTGLFNTNQTNTTLTVSGIVELVNDTFYNFFDEEGILRDEITEDELVFHGDFSGLGVNIITIPRAITIKGDNAVLYNLSYSLAGSGIKLENITLVADGADFTLNNGAAIYANGENIEINNVTVNYTAPSDKEAFGIYANNANGFKLTGSEINFNGTNHDASNKLHQYALHIYDSDNAEIKDNVIVASLPALDVQWTTSTNPLTGIYQDIVAVIAIQDSDNVNIESNVINVTTDNGYGDYPTISSVLVNTANGLTINKNNITHIDLTAEDVARYYYTIDLYSTNATIENNNLFVNTTSGIERKGSAYPIQLTGPINVIINKNNITSVSKGPNLGIYTADWAGDVNVTITDNLFNITGYSAEHNHALVSGMELQAEIAKVYNNTIYVYNIGDYDDANSIYGISYSQWYYGDHSFDIRENTVYVDGKYAVYMLNAVNSNVTENILHAHELVGDAAANISSGSGNIIKNNYLREVESITVEADNVFEGQTAVITVTVPNATGNVTIRVNGKDVATVELNENGTAVFETNEYEDVNTVNVTYNGNDKYYPISANTIFKYIGKIVTQENFYNYFDETGNLRSEIPYDELIFKGDFADLVSYITIERALTITGEDAKLENIGFIIAGEGVTLDKLELIASDLGDLITVAAPGATISNSNITYSVGEGNAIRAYYGADNLKIINNNIKFTSTLDDYDVETFANAISIDSGSDVFTRFDEDFIEGVVISNNNITAVIPSFTADAYEHEYYVMGLSSINGVRINGVTDLELTNNNINVTTNALNGYTPTFQAVYIACADGIVNGNNISMIDTLTPEGKDVYLYAMEIIYDDLTISNNNFNISTKGGKADAGAAYAIQAVDSTIKFTKNNITTVSNGPNIGIYLPSRFGAPCDLTVTDNNIDVTGLATDKYTGLVTGIEVQTGNVVIKNNNITTHNIGSYDENNYIYGVSYAQKGTKGDFVITDNNITTDGHYTISFYEVDDAQITDNYLISHDLTGDDSVEIKDGEDNTVENNRPANPKLTVTVENIIVGTEAEIIITADESINGEVKVIINGEEHTVNITNGTGKLSVPDLAAGTYNVTAEYTGDNIEFVSASNNASFTVNKLIISADDIKLGESAIINITVNENITGEVKVIVDGKEYTVAITNGTGNLTVENLTASTYKVTAVYEGNDDFASAGNETIFKVNRLNTPVTITIGDAVIGENTIVNISVPGATGNVTVIVDGEETIIPLDADGNATYTIENITAGDHNIVAIYLGDDNNAANYNKTTVSVDKLDTTLTIDPIETQTIDEAFTIKVNNETPVTVTINGKEYAVDSEGNVIVDDLTAGDYIVNVVSAETGKYNANNATATFTVEKVTPTVNITIGEVVDDEVTVTVTLPDDATGTILINVNGTVFAFSTDDVNKGKIVLAAGKYNLLKASVTTTTPYTYQVVLTRAGEYKINATYLGDDKYTNASSETVTVNVTEKPQPADTNVEVNVSDDKNSINIELPENATGNITVKVDGKEIYSGLANETENVPLGELPVGEHTVEVIYSGDENHTAKEVTETVNIEKTETAITADNVNITEGETATITVNVDSKATGLVLIDINGTKYYGEIADGKATVEVTGLTAGEYTADIKYVGDDKYANASTTVVINVTAKVVPIEPEKETPEANITVPEESKSGETPVVDVSLPENATGNVTVVVDGKEVANIPLVNGSASVPLENLTAGVHDVEVKYSGDDNYAPVTASGNISIAKASSAITADVKDISEGETATFTVNVPGDATGLVLVDINGAKYYGEIADGKATVSVPGLAAGEYTADVKYVGDDKYDNASASAKIKVTAKETPVTPDKVTPDANITIPSTANAGETPIVNIELPKDATGNVSVIVDGKETVVPVVNGTASVPLENLTPGAHSVEVKYAGDDKYSPISEVSAIAVNDVIPTKKDTILLANATLTRVANDHTKMGENGTDYYVTLTDADGKPLFNKTIQIAINGVHYYVQTDEDGNAYQQVNMESANVYTYAFAFQGDDDYNAAPLNSTRLTVTKKSTTITAKAKSFKASTKTKKITVTLTTSKNPYDGKVYLAKGKKLTLTVNGKTYTGKTNAKNQVTFSIKLTKKGKYNAKVKFAGSKIYKATTKKVKITIK